MEKVSQKEMDKRVAKLAAYVKKNSWINVAAFLGYSDVAPCKRWVSRRSVPAFVWSRLEKLLNGEASVEISIK